MYYKKLTLRPNYSQKIIPCGIHDFLEELAQLWKI